ncbi:MAG: hypothetical protein U5L01_16665 [Rheinheimera sp.]|nr:hypothetical protein [Rheinheimera sp.]
MSELLHKQVLADFSEATLQHFRPHYYRAQQALTPVRFEAMPMTTPGGRDVFLNGWLVPLVKNGQFDGMICTVDDITQQRLYEQQMLQPGLYRPTHAAAESCVFGRESPRNIR